jgi:uncharacterized protein (DUF2141 family)
MITALLLLVAAMPAASTPMVEVEIEGLRNRRGVVHACLTQDRKAFPDCKRDPKALKLTVPADQRQLRFSGFAPGDYALTLFHDENANRKLDTVLGIPREGFGFSRNPIVRFGAPRYKDVNISIGSGFTRVRVRLQYML